MKTRTILAVWAYCLASVAAAATKSGVPELKQGDLIFCADYPRRTITETAPTVYRIARLGFPSVKAFQKTNGLKVDGIIGPNTRATAEKLFKQASKKPLPPQTVSPLDVTFEFKPAKAGHAIVYTIRNRSAIAQRLVGSISFDASDTFVFGSPALATRGRICSYKGAKVACSTSRGMISLKSAGPELAAGERIQVDGGPMVTAADESRTHGVSAAYLDASLSVHRMHHEKKVPK